MTLLSLPTCGPGIVPEKLLNDYLSRIFSPDRASTLATSRYGWVGHPPLSAGPDWRLEAALWGRGPGPWVGWHGFRSHAATPGCDTSGQSVCLLDSVFSSPRQC